MTTKVVIIGGGTVFHVRPHLALSAPAYGKTAWDLEDILLSEWPSAEVQVYVTQMANGRYMNPGGEKLETNEDVMNFIESKVLPDPDVKALFMPVALCDFEVTSINVVDHDETKGIFHSSLAAGKDQSRLKTAHYQPTIRQNIYGEDIGPLPELSLSLRPADKLISRVRRERKDIFLVGFKTTTGASLDEQFEAGLTLLKKSSCNLVLANDTFSRLNMVITPEQAKYHVSTDRTTALRGLVEMVVARANDAFTRSTVVPGELVPWTSPEVPESLRVVVNHLIKRGAYRPFLGATVGHFAVKVDDSRFLTSVRKTDFNNLEKAGLVKVEVRGDDEVVAYGGKPSVGGQSQRIVFQNHPGYDCIAHAHIQLKPGSKVPVRSQWPHECGSHSCGQNTSDGLKDFDGIRAVFLDKHGPNIVFKRDVDPQKVIQFIEDNFDVEHQTSELT